ncbi:MAG: HAMP domain-containing histidine kinase [Saprospiraceae bacterium]|nr:HAMP domain-containing histidine kinase [Saprospiraceae bacterium]
MEAFANFATIALLSDDYIRRIQEERKRISEELQKLGEKQIAMKKDAEKLKNDKIELQAQINENNDLLEEILPRAAGASFFLVLQGINHDIRNMLMEMWADLDEFKEDLPDKYQDPLKGLSRQVEVNALKITNLLKLFDPSEQNTREAFSINDVIEEVLFFFKNNENHIKFRTDLALGMPNLISNKTEFSMIVYNLVKNAIQAIPKGKQGEIKVQTKLEQKKYLVSVQDNGDGIDNNDLEKIYDLRFSKKENGVGIGLYFVRETILNKLEGQIRVNSQKGKGTTFFIEIPEHINFKK